MKATRFTRLDGWARDVLVELALRWNGSAAPAGGAARAAAGVFVAALALGSVLVPVTEAQIGLAPGQTLNVSSGGSYDVCVADVDKDGDLDVISGDYRGTTIRVLLNQGGVLVPQTPITVGSFPTGIQSADLDGDGFPDLVVGRDGVPPSPGVVVVLFNDKTGNFPTSQPLSVPNTSGATEVALVDLDGDGRIDIVTEDTTAQTVSVFQSQPSGFFVLVQSLKAPMPNIVGPVVAADVDQDGRPDIAAVLPFANQVVVFLNKSGPGNFAFVFTQAIPVGAQPQTAVLTDLNGDGFPDLATANLLGPNASIVLNMGSPAGTWLGFGVQKPLQLSGGPVGIDAADLDNDGDSDLFVASDPGVNIPGQLFVLRNDGSGAFNLQPQVTALPPGPRWVTHGDLDNDCDIDIVGGCGLDATQVPADVYVVNNAAGPPILASATIRNGSGINPVDFATVTLPKLGTSWNTSIATNPATMSTFVAVAIGAPQQVPLLGGELLIPFSLLFLDANAGTHFIAVPNNVGLTGAQVLTQGVRVDMSPTTGVIVTLLNALDLTLGC